MLLDAFLEHTARRFPQKTALVCGKTRRSYQWIDQEANRLAQTLIAGGVQSGDRVVIFLENSVEAAVSIFAVLRAGGVFVVLHPTTKASKLAYVIQDSGARALVTDARKLAATGATLESLSDLKMVYTVDRAVSVPQLLLDRTSCLLDLPAGERPTARPPFTRRIDVDLAALVYTSGSTGVPKGVILTHRNMVAAATSITTYLESRPEDVVLSALPLSFDYGLYQWLMSVKTGSTLVLESSFTYPAVVLNRIADEAVTALPLVPTMLSMLLRMDLTPYDLSALSYVTNTAAALPPSHIAELQARVPNVKIISMYGLTECKRVSFLPHDQIGIRPGSVGKAMPNTEAYVVDERGRRLGPGETGELIVRGASVMQGYWRDPIATERALRPGELPGERVLYTGDMFRTDDEGYLYFVGRMDDIIKSRGEKVSPREVEDTICQMEGIGEAAVIGVRDPVLGEAIHAFVTLRENTDLAPATIRAHCALKLESFMVPARVTVLDTFPKTPAGKVDKRALAEVEASHGRTQ